MYVIRKTRVIGQLQGTRGFVVPTVVSTSFLYDTFTASDGTLLVNAPHSPETGGAWSLGVHNAGDDTFITSNRLRGAAVGDSYFENAATPPSADYDVEALVYFISTGTSFRAGVLGRVDKAGINYYRAWYNGNSGNWELDKNVGGSVTNLGTFADSPSATNTRIVRLKMTGTSIEVFIDGVSRIGPVTDSAVSAAGKVNCVVLQGSDTTGYALDYIWAGANGGTVGP